jgi:hypothetical protein
MSTFELLTVEDCFEIGDVGVVLRPDFPAPDGRWTARADTVAVATPDGQSFQTRAELTLWHFNISDPNVPIDRRWRVIVSLPGRMKKDVPAGTRILVSENLRDALIPKQSG